MGLQNTFKSAAQSIVTSFGDVAASTVYASFSSTTYNASAGTQTAVYSSTAGVKVIFDKFELAKIDNINIKPEDKKALIPAKNISAITPKPNDQIRASGVVWNVVNVVTDPASALWECQVRKV
tara:strand:- start:769 stop:1137 length:369 start_codon:yes stop_codon:yes gene_type:complete